MNRQRLPVAIAIFLACTSIADARLYRWVDEQGQVHYSDHVPPEQAQTGRSVLSGEGIRIREISPSKTQEDLARERELQRQRDEQQKLAEKQKELDRRLLRSFPSEDEIIMARDGKLATVDLNIGILSHNVERMKQRLVDLQDAVEHQKDNGKLVTSYNSEISGLQPQIEEAYATILREHQRKQDIRNEYSDHQRRYRELKHLSPLAEGTGAPVTEGNIDALMETVAACKGDQECATRWQRALEYARHHAQTRVALAEETIFITAPAARNEEISLTVSLVPRSEERDCWIFLDLQCKATAVGQEICRGQAAQAIRSGFKAAVIDGAPPDA